MIHVPPDSDQILFFQEGVDEFLVYIPVFLFRAKDFRHIDSYGH